MSNMDNKTMDNATIEEKLENLNNILDEYEHLNGLPKFQSNEIADEINQYFIMDRTTLGKLSGEECAEIAVRLTQQSVYVQRLYNKERAQVISMEVALDKFSAKYVGNYDPYMKHELKIAAIVNEHEYAKKLQTIIVKAKQRMTRLYSISEKLQSLSQSMLNLQRSKSQLNKGG